MKLVSKNLFICSHKISAVSKLNKRPRTIFFVCLDRTFPRQRTASICRLSSVKNPMRISASNNQLLENYIKLQRKKPQILPNTGNWLCYEEIQNVANIMRDFPHSFKRDVNTGLLENHSGYRSKVPIFADNFNLFWSSKIKETYDRIRDFPVNMFWAPLQNRLALNYVGTTRISEISSIRWFTSKGPHSGLERIRRPGGKIGRLNKTSAEYMALYNKLQKSRLEELKKKFKSIKLEMERKEAEMKKKYAEMPPSPLSKSTEPMVPPNLERTAASATANMKSNEIFDPPSSTSMETSLKENTLEATETIKGNEILEYSSSSAMDTTMKKNVLENTAAMKRNEIFDPPSSSAMATSMKKDASEGKSHAEEKK